EHVGASRDELACLDEQALQADRGAVERLRGAKILAAIEFGLVAISDKARPELGAFVARVHVRREPRHVGKAPPSRRDSRFGHVGGKIEAAVDARVGHARSLSYRCYVMRAAQRTDLPVCFAISGLTDNWPVEYIVTP